MWKPGKAKPSGSYLTKSQEKKKKKEKEGTKKNNLDLSIGDSGDMSLPSPNTPSSATPRKRLSGGTMNMRFMKRHKPDTNEEGSDRTAPDSHTKQSPAHARLQNNNAMDIDSENDMKTENHYNDGSKYAPASSADMYGIEAQLIGRRSFRGFNEPIERIWKESKGRLENRGLNDRPGKKISDEELLQRYKDIARERGNKGGARGIGNFDKKNKNKNRR